jgi:hypothetical protein
MALRARAADALMSCDEAYELQHLVGGDAQTDREHISAREPGSLPFDRPLM